MNSNLNVLALAYLGDAVYELRVRTYLLNNGIEKVNNLQKESIKYVSAKSQAAFIKNMLDNDFLTDEEVAIFKRARNHKSKSSPKNTDIVTYKYSTGLEALVGALYIDNNEKRIDEIMDFILGGSLC